jgi:lipopolysaccharide biosynthesis protein
VITFPRALIFAHFDPDGMVDAHILHALHDYRERFRRVVFVTTAALSNRADVLPLVDDLIERPNEGLDFYSWKVGLQKLGAPTDYFEVIFCNDSMYGPLYDLDQALLCPSVREADLWGMSFSWQIRPHIQSYFFAMRNRLFAEGAAQGFWNAVRPLPSKDAVIETYELGLMETFRSRGYGVGAVYRPPDRDFRNPTLQIWRDLLIAGVPYLKVALLRLHSNERDVREIMDYVKKISKYPSLLIDRHLLRTRPRTGHLGLP